MKRSIHLSMVVSALVAATVASAAEAMIAIGDTETTVLEAMGEPSGYIRMDGMQMLYYDRGHVKINDGVVSEVSLISDAQLTARRKAAQNARMRAARREAERREELQLEGLAIKQRMLEGGELDGETAQNQVAAWSDFRNRYPGVPVETQLASALQRLEFQLDRDRIEAEGRRRDLETQLRIAELQERVARTEQRARDAEQRARDAEDAARRSRYSYTYPVNVTHYPVQTSHRSHHAHFSVTSPETCTTTKTTFGTGAIRQEVTRTTCAPTVSSSRTVIRSRLHKETSSRHLGVTALHMRGNAGARVTF